MGIMQGERKEVKIWKRGMGERMGEKRRERRKRKRRERRWEDRLAEGSTVGSEGILKELEGRKGEEGGGVPEIWRQGAHQL